MHEGSLEGSLTEGQVVEVRFNEKQNWVSTVLYRVYNSVLEIELQHERAPLDDFVAIGDSLDCRYKSGGSEYIAQGWISKIKNDVPQRLTVQIHKMTKVENVQGEVGYDIFIGCIVRANPKEKGTFSIAKKISKHSLTITYKSGLEGRDRMFLELLLPDNITFKSSIKFSDADKVNDGKEIVVKFIDTDILNTKILDNFLVELKNAEPEKFNKKDSFWVKNSKINS